MCVPDDVRALLEATYTEDAAGDPEWAQDLMDDLNRKRQCLRRQAVGMTRTDLPTFTDEEEAAPTRWSDRPMVQVVLVRECDVLGRKARLTLSSGRELEVSADAPSVQAARDVHRNLVSLPRWPDFSDVSGAPPYLTTCVHGAVVVLRIDEEGRLRRQDHAPVAYAYDDWAGVRRMAGDARTGQADDLEDIYESDW